jgi:hypothetical protein
MTATVIRRDRGFLAFGAELLTQDGINYTDVHVKIKPLKTWRISLLQLKTVVLLGK